MIKKKESVFRLILEGNILAQLQVDKDLKNLLMLFFKSCAHVLYHYWTGMGTCRIFFLFAIKCFLS